MDAKVNKAVMIVEDAINFAQRDLSNIQYQSFLNKLLEEAELWSTIHDDLLLDHGELDEDEKEVAL